MAETTRAEQHLTYTHEWYRSFLEDLTARGYSFESFGGTPREGVAYLRHDVDLSLTRSLEMARIEADAGATSTYFVQLGSPLYNAHEGVHRRAIEEIAALGHEIGLHFSTHEHFDGEPEPAALVDRVRDEQTVLETIYPDAAAVVSFHIPPEWVLDRAFAGLTSAFEPRYFSEMRYVADSTGRWRERPPDDLSAPEPIQVLTHPGLWAGTDATFADRVDEASSAACHRIREAANRQFLEGDDV